MTNRREFLQAAALSGLPTLAGAAGLVEISRPRPSPNLDLHTVLVDGRHGEAIAVGSFVMRAGTAVRTLRDGDITQVWLNEIGPAWRREPRTIAGLTARPALFCFEQLAWSCGLRVVFHGEHVIHADGHPEHSVPRGAREAQLSVSDLARAGQLWPAYVAHALLVHRQQAACRHGPTDAGLEPPLPPGARLLTSWIIAAA
jgi:hypothetical protein